MFEKKKKFLASSFKKGEKKFDEDASDASDASSLKTLSNRLDQQQQQLDFITDLAQKRRQILLNEKIEQNIEANDYLTRVHLSANGRIAEKKNQVGQILKSLQRVVHEETKKLEQAKTYVDQTEKELARVRDLSHADMSMMSTQKEEEKKRGLIRNMIMNKISGPAKKRKLLKQIQDRPDEAMTPF